MHIVIGYIINVYFHWIEMQQWGANAYAEAKNTKRKYEKVQKNLEINTMFSD